MRDTNRAFAIAHLTGIQSADKTLLLPATVDGTRRVMKRIDAKQCDVTGVFNTKHYLVFIAIYIYRTGLGIGVPAIHIMRNF